jgi:hypothetical protein
MIKKCPYKMAANIIAGNENLSANSVECEYDECAKWIPDCKGECEKYVLAKTDEEKDELCEGCKLFLSGHCGK